jgi:hypothetical protein
MSVFALTLLFAITNVLLFNEFTVSIMCLDCSLGSFMTSLVVAEDAIGDNATAKRKQPDPTSGDATGDNPAAKRKKLDSTPGDVPSSGDDGGKDDSGGGFGDGPQDGSGAGSGDGSQDDDEGDDEENDEGDGSGDGSQDDDEGDDEENDEGDGSGDGSGGGSQDDDEGGDEENDEGGGSGGNSGGNSGDDSEGDSEGDGAKIFNKLPKTTTSQSVLEWAKRVVWELYEGGTERDVKLEHVFFHEKVAFVFFPNLFKETSWKDVCGEDFTHSKLKSFIWERLHGKRLNSSVSAFFCNIADAIWLLAEVELHGDGALRDLQALGMGGREKEYEELSSQFETTLITLKEAQKELLDILKFMDKTDNRSVIPSQEKLNQIRVEWSDVIERTRVRLGVKVQNYSWKHL